MDEAITNYIRSQYNLLIGEATAERIKKEIGSASYPKDGKGKQLKIKGRDFVSGLPKEVTLTEYSIAESLVEPVNQIIEVRPTPQLAFSATVPDFYCVSDSNQRLILSASPGGGVFEDVINGVISGIVADSFFNPIVQLGVREITYRYRDSTSGCSDTLAKIINVYNQPEAGYSSGVVS